jgi:hypothetical protein
MGKTRKVFTQVVAIVLLLGILTVGVYGLYIGMGELDKPVSLIKTDSVSNYIEINGFNIRRDALIQDGVVDETTNKVESGGPTLDEVLKAEFAIDDSHYNDYSIFGAGKNDVQKLYIQSVLNSINSGNTIHVSRWVTSGDWSQDNEDMTITIP